MSEGKITHALIRHSEPAELKSWLKPHRPKRSFRATGFDPAQVETGI